MFTRKVKNIDYASIRERYQDTSLVIYKKQQQDFKGKSSWRTSRKLSIIFPDFPRRKGSVRGDNLNGSNQLENNITPQPAVVLQSAENNFRHESRENSEVVSVDKVTEALDLNEIHRLGVQSKVCSVL